MLKLSEEQRAAQASCRREGVADDEAAQVLDGRRACSWSARARCRRSSRARRCCTGGRRGRSARLSEGVGAERPVRVERVVDEAARVPAVDDPRGTAGAQVEPQCSRATRAAP